MSQYLNYNGIKLILEIDLLVLYNFGEYKERVKSKGKQNGGIIDNSHDMKVAKLATAP